MASKKIYYWFGNILKETGKTLENLGHSVQGNLAYKKPVSYHRRVMGLFDKKPILGSKCWIAPNASVIGSVELGEKASIFYGAVLRGDLNNIKVGKGTVIGDKVVIQGSSGFPYGKLPTIIGNNVMIDHGTSLHACTIEDGCVIGMGCSILDGAVVGKNSILEAGSFVSPETNIPSGELWGGYPAQFIRKLSEDDFENMKKTSTFYNDLASQHAQEHEKTWQQQKEEHDKIQEFKPQEP